MVLPIVRRIGVVLALLCSTVAIGGSTTHAGPGEQIVGTVVNSDGVGIEGITVWICLVGSGGCTTPMTDAAGQWTFDDYTDGFYNFWLFDDSGVYVKQVWPTGSSPRDIFPTSVDYTAGGDRTVAHTMLRRPTLEGRVTDNFGNPLADIDVRFSGPGLIDPEVTDADGRYSTRLDEGDYTVAFNQFDRDFDHPVEYWADTETFADRATITATAEEVITGVDASLFTFGKITGTVTDETGTPIEGVTVRGNTDGFTNNSSAITGADGSYTMLVRDDDYRVTFASPNHVDEGWENVGRFDNAGQTVISVTEGQLVPDISPQLAGTGVVTGTVTDSNGAPIGDAEVSLSGIGFSAGRVVATEADGTFEAVDMTPGPYTVRFSAPGFFTEWHDDTRDKSAAAPFTVTATSSVVDAVLAPSGIIAGQITDHLGQPRRGSATATSATGETTMVTSDADGNYLISDLDAGSYDVFFSNGGPYVSDFARNPDFSIQSVEVELGATAVLDHRFRQSTTLAGTVTATGTGPLSGVAVFVCRIDSIDCESGATSSTGTYVVEDLLPGPYSVKFQAPFPQVYLDEYYDNALTVERSTVIDIAEAVPVTGIDAELGQAGSISGFVSHPTGRGLFASELRVEACSASLGFCSGPYPPGPLFGNEQGEYSIPGLPPATDYIVKFDGSPFAAVGDEKLADEWFRNASSAADATPVTVISGSDTVGIDASLPAVGDPEPEPDDRDPFFSIEPVRLADTRAGERTIDGDFNGDGIVGTQRTYEVQIAGRPGVPAGATAAILNLTATQTAAPGFATVFPCDTMPLAASLTYGPNDTRSNEIITKLSPTGTICIYTEAAAHYVVDTVGFVSNSPYVAIDPVRFADTRAGEKTIDDAFNGDGIVETRRTYEIQIAGRPGVPEDATAAVLNLTATGTTGPGFATVYPCDTMPLAASLTYGPNDTRSNEIVTKLSPTGTICIYTETAAHYVVDTVGYFAASGYTAITPKRFVDTRPGEETIDGLFEGAGSLDAGQTAQIDIAGRAPVPAEATSVVLNVSVTQTAGAGFITLSTCGDLPLAAALTFGAGDTRSNEVVARLSGDGSVCAFTSAGTHLVVDVVGFI